MKTITAHSEGGYVTKSGKTPLYCIIAKVCQKCAYDMKHHSIVEIVRTLWRRSSFLGLVFPIIFFQNSLTVLGSQLVGPRSKNESCGLIGLSSNKWTKCPNPVILRNLFTVENMWLEVGRKAKMFTY